MGNCCCFPQKYDIIKDDSYKQTTKFDNFDEVYLLHSPYAPHIPEVVEDEAGEPTRIKFGYDS